MTGSTSANDLRAVLVDIARITAGDLVRQADLGDLAFGEAANDFRVIGHVAARLIASRLEDITAGQAAQMRAYSDVVRDCLQRIMEFSPDGGDASEKRRQLLEDLAKAYESFGSYAAIVLALAQPPGNEQAASARRPEEIVSDLLGLKEKAETDLDETNRRVATILESLHTASAQIGTTKFRDLFERQAKEHEDGARRWLRFTAALAIVAGIYVGYALFAARPPAVDTVGHNLQLGLSNVFAFSILLSALVWCARIYRTHQHNRLVNLQRQIALETFEALVNAATDSATKNAVLLKATDAIFSPPTTGLVSQETPSGGSPLPKILELIRGVAG